MPHLPPVHHETSKRDSPNKTKVKEKQNETIPYLNSNLAQVNDSSQSNQGTHHLISHSDFISNSNFNPVGLLSRSYISLGAPPPRPSTQISPQNQPLATTLPVPLITATPFPKSSPQIKPCANHEKTMT
jgi:hypothetical protein